MSDKIRIRVGEIEYEGDKEFAMSELPELVKALSENHGVAQDVNGTATADRPETNGEAGSGAATNLSTDSVAANLGIDAQKDLVIAASAKLTFVEGKDTFSRDDIRNAMKEATSRYTETHSKNLTRYLNQLVTSKDLLKHEKNTYALHASTKEDLREKALG